MGLFGAIGSAVSGLNAQSTSLSVISDNVSNINTVGYKGTQTNFSTLVTSSVSSISYSSGGVNAGTRQQIDSQGLIQGTGVVTDLAISGKGMFVVNTQPDGSGDFLYTRSGAFRKDSRGNFVNGAGFYLYAWPLDSQGRLPGEIGNLNTTASPLIESLNAVNLNSVTGIAAASSQVTVGMNLDKSQTILKGAGDVIDFSTGGTFNQNNAAKDIIIPNAANNMQVGDAFTVTSAGTTSTFTYGGFTVSNDITSGTGILGALTPTQLLSGATANDRFTITTPTSGVVTFAYTPSSPNSLLGQFNSLSSLASAINDTPGLTARVVSNQLYVSPENAEESMTFEDVQGGVANHLGLTGRSADLTLNNVLGAADATSDFTGATDNVDSFTVTTSLGTLTFTYRIPATPPSAAAGEFSTLTELVAAINDPAQGPTIGIQASLIGDAIHITSTTPTPLAFTDVAGTFVADLGLVGGTSALNNRFNSINSLADLVNNSTGIKAIIENPLDDSTLEIHAEDPLGTIEFGVTPTLGVSSAVGSAAAALGLAADDGDQISVTVSGTTYLFTYRDPAVPTATLGEFTSMNDLAAAINAFAANDLSASVTGNVLTITGLNDKVITNIADVDNGAASVGPIAAGINLVGQTSNFLGEFNIGKGPFGPAYDPTGGAVGNMADGTVIPHFSRNVRIFDAQGTGHDLRMSFVKLADNLWGSEIYVVDPTTLVSNRTDGLIASGNIRFNGDGSLRSIDTALTSSITAAWTDGAAPTDLEFFFGTAGSPAGTPGATTVGQTDGLRQYDSAFNVDFVEQNGVAAGLLSGLSISEEGLVIANFSNGETRQIFKIPLADFANPNGLQVVAGNAYRETQASGNFNLREPGEGGAGTISAASVETANVELADELTRMIVAQRGYQASSRVISTVNDLLDELNRIF